MGRKLDLGELTEEEEKIILDVIKRDYTVRKVETDRIGHLSDDVKKVEKKQKEVVKTAKKDEVPVDTLCAKCGSKFIWIINPKTQCEGCELYFCKNKIDCITYDKVSKKCFCQACVKQRDLNSFAGEWFYSKLKGKFRRHGGAKVSREINKRRKSQKPECESSPPTPPKLTGRHTGDEGSISPSSSIVSTPSLRRHRPSERSYDTASQTSREELKGVTEVQEYVHIEAVQVETTLQSTPPTFSDIEVQTDDLGTYEDDKLPAIKEELEAAISKILLPKLEELKKAQLEHQTEVDRQQQFEESVRLAEEMIDQALERAREKHIRNPEEENIILAKYLSDSKTELMNKVTTQLHDEPLSESNFETSTKSVQSSLRETGTMTETSDSEMESSSSASGRKKSSKDVPLSERLSSLSPNSLRKTFSQSLGSSGSSITLGVVLQKDQLVARADIDNTLEEILDEHGVRLRGSTSPQEFSTELKFAAVGTGRRPRLPTDDISDSSDEESSKSERLLTSDVNWSTPEPQQRYSQFGSTGISKSSDTFMSIESDVASPYINLTNGTHDDDSSDSDREHVYEEQVLASQVRRPHVPIAPQSLVSRRVEIVETLPEKKPRLPVDVAVNPLILRSLSQELEDTNATKKQPPTPLSPPVVEEVIQAVDREATESSAPAENGEQISAVARIPEKLTAKNSSDSAYYSDGPTVTPGSPSSESELSAIPEAAKEESSEDSSSESDASSVKQTKSKNSYIKPARHHSAGPSVSVQSSLSYDSELMADRDDIDDKFEEVLANKQRELKFEPEQREVDVKIPSFPRESMSSMSDKESTKADESSSDESPTPTDDDKKEEVSVVAMRMINEKSLDILTNAMQKIEDDRSSHTSSSSSSSRSAGSSVHENAENLQKMNETEEAIYKNAAQTFAMEEKLDQLERVTTGLNRTDPGIQKVMQDIEAEIDKAEKHMVDIRRGGKSIDAICQELRGAGLEVHRGGFKRTSFDVAPVSIPAATPEPKKYPARHSFPPRSASLNLVESSRPVNAVDKDQPSWMKNTFTVIPRQKMTPVTDRPLSHSTPKAKSSSVSSDSSHSISSEDTKNFKSPKVHVQSFQDSKKPTELQVEKETTEEIIPAKNFKQVFTKFESQDVSKDSSSSSDSSESESENSEPSIEQGLHGEVEEEKKEEKIVFSDKRQKMTPVTDIPLSHSTPKAKSSSVSSDSSHSMSSEGIKDVKSPKVHVQSFEDSKKPTELQVEKETTEEIIPAKNFQQIFTKFESQDVSKDSSSSSDSSESESENLEPSIKQRLHSKGEEEKREEKIVFDDKRQKMTPVVDIPFSHSTPKAKSSSVSSDSSHSMTSEDTKDAKSAKVHVQSFVDSKKPAEIQVEKETTEEIIPAKNFQQIFTKFESQDVSKDSSSSSDSSESESENLEPSIKHGLHGKGEEEKREEKIVFDDKRQKTTPVADIYLSHSTPKAKSSSVSSDLSHSISSEDTKTVESPKVHAQSFQDSKKQTELQATIAAILNRSSRAKSLSYFKHSVDRSDFSNTNANNSSLTESKGFSAATAPLQTPTDPPKSSGSSSTSESSVNVDESSGRDGRSERSSTELKSPFHQLKSVFERELPPQKTAEVSGTVSRSSAEVQEATALPVLRSPSPSHSAHSSSSNTSVSSLDSSDEEAEGITYEAGLTIDDAAVPKPLVMQRIMEAPEVEEVLTVPAAEERSFTVNSAEKESTEEIVPAKNFQQIMKKFESQDASKDSSSSSDSGESGSKYSDPLIKQGLHGKGQEENREEEIVIKTKKSLSVDTQSTKSGSSVKSENSPKKSFSVDAPSTKSKSSVKSENTPKRSFSVDTQSTKSGSSVKSGFTPKKSKILRDDSWMKKESDEEVVDKESLKDSFTVEVTVTETKILKDDSWIKDEKPASKESQKDSLPGEIVVTETKVLKDNSWIKKEESTDEESAKGSSSDDSSSSESKILRDDSWMMKESDDEEVVDKESLKDSFSVEVTVTETKILKDDSWIKDEKPASTGSVKDSLSGEIVVTEAKVLKDNSWIKKEESTDEESAKGSSSDDSSSSSSGSEILKDSSLVKHDKDEKVAGVELVDDSATVKSTDTTPTNKSGRFENLSAAEQREMARIALLHLPETIIAEDHYETKRVTVISTQSTEPKSPTPTKRRILQPVVKEKAILQQEIVPSLAPDDVKSMAEVHHETSSSSSSSSSSAESTPRAKKRIAKFNSANGQAQNGGMRHDGSTKKSSELFPNGRSTLSVKK